MSQISIHTITDPSDSLVDIVHDDLFSKYFKESILDTAEDMKGEIAKTKEGDHKAPYIFHVAVENSGSEGKRVVGGITGNCFPDESACAIAYLAVDPDARGNGIGKMLADSYITAAKSINSGYGKSLRSIILEAMTPTAHDSSVYDARPFWNKLGFRVPDGSDYKIPPGEYDRDGNPVYEPEPETLMVKMMDGSDKVSSRYLESVVRSLFKNWYTPDNESMSKEGSKKAQKYFLNLLETYLKTINVRDDGTVDLKKYVEGKIAELKSLKGESKKKGKKDAKKDSSDKGRSEDSDTKSETSEDCGSEEGSDDKSEGSSEAAPAEA